MISVDIAGHCFQMRAAAEFVHDTFWALSGGRVGAGEDAQTTLVREMREEFDDVIECVEPLYVVENSFVSLNWPKHESGLYFHARFHPGSVLLDKSKRHAGMEGGNRLE